MKEIGAIFVVSISEIRTVQLAAIKRRYTLLQRFMRQICFVTSCRLKWERTYVSFAQLLPISLESLERVIR